MARHTIHLSLGEEDVKHLKRLQLRTNNQNPHAVIKECLSLLANVSVPEFNALRRYHAEALQSGSKYRRLNDNNSKVGRAGGVDYLIDMKRQGYTETQVAEILGYSSSSMISVWLRNRGLSWAKLR